jgi:hypothetical protein
MIMDRDGSVIIPRNGIVCNTQKKKKYTRRFGTWNVRSLYRVGSLMTVSRELSRYRLDLVGVQEVRWQGSGTVPVRE